MIKTLSVITSLVISIFFVAQVAQATTYYVATTGNNANSCATATNIATPKATPVNAVACLAPGDTLLIRAGSYSGRISDGIAGGTSYANAPIIKAFPGESVTLLGQTEAITLIGANSHYIIFQDLIIRNSSSSCIGINSGASGSAHHIRFINIDCGFSGISGVLIGPYNTDTFIEFLGGSSHDNGSTPNQDHGWYIQSGSNLLDGVQGYNNAAYGVQTYNSDTTGHRANNNVIRNSRFYNNSTNSASSAGILLGAGTSNIAYNNLIWGNKNGIQIDYNCTNCALYNNTVYGNSPGIAIGVGQNAGTSTGSIVRNNITYGNTDNSLYAPAGVTQSDNLLGSPNPLFVNAPAHDFHLQIGSPAIDRGAALATVAIDFNGTPRPQMNAYDIGAIEFTGTADSVPPASPRGLSVQ